MQDSTATKIWSLGMFINRGKNVFSQPWPCKKIAVKFVIFFFQQIFILFFFYLVVIVFFRIKTKSL